MHWCFRSGQPTQENYIKAGLTEWCGYDEIFNKAKITESIPTIFWGMILDTSEEKVGEYKK